VLIEREGVLAVANEPSIELIGAIRALVAEQTNVAIEDITVETTLASDLGIDGDDAWELLEKYAEKFNVSMRGFVFLDHFDWEGMDPIRPIIILLLQICWPRFRRLWREAKANEREITIRHLAICATLEHWVPSGVPKRPHWRNRRGSTLSRLLIAGFALIMFLIAESVACLIFVGTVAGSVLASFLAVEALLVSRLSNALIPAVVGICCIAALGWMFAHTRWYLSAKEVWQRVSPVA
jgi:acyl carrier protein